MPSSSRLKEARSEFQPISRRMKLLYLSQTQGPAFQWSICQKYSIGFGKHKEPSTWEVDWAYPLPRALSRLMVEGSGLKANWVKAVYFRLVFPLPMILNGNLTPLKLGNSLVNISPERIGGQEAWRRHRRKHHVARERVIVPMNARGQVYRTELPLTKRIVNAGLKSPCLFVVVYFEPVLDQMDSIRHDKLLKRGAPLQKLTVFFFGTKPHDIFHSGAVVPAPVEDHDLACRRKVRQVSLQVNLTFLAVRWSGKRDDPEYARADAFRDRFDRAAFSGAVAAFE